MQVRLDGLVTKKHGLIRWHQMDRQPDYYCGWISNRARRVVWRLYKRSLLRHWRSGGTFEADRRGGTVERWSIDRHGMHVTLRSGQRRDLRWSDIADLRYQRVVLHDRTTIRVSLHRSAEWALARARRECVPAAIPNERRRLFWFVTWCVAAFSVLTMPLIWYMESLDPPPRDLAMVILVCVLGRVALMVLPFQTKRKLRPVLHSQAAR